MDIEKTINDFIYNCVNSVLQQAFTFIAKILFEPHEMPAFFKTVYGIFLALGVTTMICIISFKLIQYMFDLSNDQSQTTPGEIVTRTIKSSFMIVVAPLLLTVIVGQIVYPLGEYMFSNVAEDMATTVANYITSIGGLMSETGGFVFILMLLFVTVSVVCFFFKMCVYHADLVLLEVLSVWAAISLCADDNNYMSIWWREVLSQITTILVQTLLMAGVISILASTFEWYNFMLLIGFCCLMIKGPSVLRNMWYSTGTGKTAMQGGKMLTRQLMTKILTKGLV